MSSSSDDAEVESILLTRRTEEPSSPAFMPVAGPSSATSWRRSPPRRHEPHPTRSRASAALRLSTPTSSLGEPSSSQPEPRWSFRKLAPKNYRIATLEEVERLERLQALKERQAKSLMASLARTQARDASASVVDDGDGGKEDGEPNSIVGSIRAASEVPLGMDDDGDEPPAQTAADLFPDIKLGSAEARARLATAQRFRVYQVSSPSATAEPAVVDEGFITLPPRSSHALGGSRKVSPSRRAPRKQPRPRRRVVEADDRLV